MNSGFPKVHENLQYTMLPYFMLLELQVWTCYKSELSFMFLARSGMSSANWILLNLMKSEVGNTSCLWTISTPRCQINKSTRLSFLDFPSTLYLDMSYLISHPTRLFAPTQFAFPPYSFIWPYFLWNLLRISTLLVYLALLV